MQRTPGLEQQIKVSKMLGLGFVFSITLIGGISSLIALVIGLRARKLIRRSNGELVGIKLAWWCIIAGSLGVITVLPYIIWLSVRALKHG
jgi:hypothetical protein